ncbi:phosphopantothenoylcysteine decarboxylase [Exaiptasia diaphana]|uniref:Phosphopantothenoylcysteine decarboxylase n=1 Tax=Exaiptasia diaphana TaxID=2652724 RepID=A0A913Y7R2_EXADI|nr:phosphopantothenoylcysteine decarboxylase [Exaiptasia diaphana]KXJ28807.1 Phosphopantothenoylcysteine decarboxylase [Exaiptasia diaphana]
MAEDVRESISLPSKKRVLICVTGSVATVKLGQLVGELLLSNKVEVQVVATENSTHFFKTEEIPVKVYRDKDEWQGWKKMRDPVLHIELRKWADVMVIAPLDANTMAKISTGICDNLLTCIVRAWDMKKPLIFCPAMNTCMWDHPLTNTHVSVLCNLGYIYVPPIAKTLACGDTGVGAMADVRCIVETVLQSLVEKC